VKSTELAQDLAHCLAFILVALKLRIILPPSSLGTWAGET
jgi:hypothetical protein